MAKSWMSKEITTLRRSLHSLAKAFGDFGDALGRIQRASTNGAGTSSKPARRRMRLTPKRRAALKLQGKYLGTMRGLKPRQRSAVKRIRAEKGIQAAIREAVRLAS
jgi:hypothetical protein